MPQQPEVVDAEVEEIGQAVELRSAAPVSLFRTDEPAEVLVRATEMAKPLAAVIKKQKLHKRIGDKEHVLVEGWTLLGSMLGVFPVCVWTRKIENGWEARVEARTLDGRVVGSAESMCLRSESLWKTRDEYALRSMAQTRASSKALRQPLGFVMQLAGFDPTPAEEMPTQSAGEPRASRTGRAADQPKPAGKGSASPAESQFKPPSGPRGGQSTQIETDELAKELVALVTELGATDSLDSIEAHRAAGDAPWFKRQIAAAKKHLEKQ